MMIQHVLSEIERFSGTWWATLVYNVALAAVVVGVVLILKHDWKRNGD